MKQIFLCVLPILFPVILSAQSLVSLIAEESCTCIEDLAVQQAIMNREAVVSVCIQQAIMNNGIAILQSLWS